MDYSNEIKAKMEEFKLQLPTYIESFEYLEEFGNIKMKASVRKITDELLLFASYIDNKENWLVQFNYVVAKMERVHLNLPLEPEEN